MQRHHRLTATALGLVALGFAALVPAQPPGSAGPMTFNDLDKNSDGVITETELAETHAERMATRAAQGGLMRGAANPPSISDFDRNGDDQLTPDEFSAAQSDRRQQVMPPR